MSQTKVQLIAPIGVVTASTLETTGVLTATTFVGDIAGTVTGITSTTDNLNLGIVTATSFAGDFTGIGSGLTGTPNIVAGVVTATKFVGNTPGTVSGLADGTNINAGIITATSFVGNLTGNAAGLSTTTAQLTLGIVTATSYSGSGANLDGVSSGPVGQQAVTANSGTTAIDLSSGNVIYMTQSSNTTVSFANTEGNTDVVYLIRTKDDTATARTITWPSGFVWDGGTEPTLLSVNKAAVYEAQVFKLTTRDNGATWYGKEVVKYNVDESGELWAWGSNTTGELGQNSVVQYSSPVQVPGTNWRYYDMSGSVSSGRDYLSSVIKDDNTLWHWGGAQYGGSGLNNVVQYSSPVQLPGSWATISHDIAAGGVKTDGTMWGWGLNQVGQIGNSAAIPGNGRTYMSSPIQIPGTTWGTKRQQLSKSRLVGLGIKTDGTLWSWGNNQKGSLAQNNLVQYSSPVQIPGTTWSQVFGRRGSSYSIKTDGTLWTWGDNPVGQLGLNNTTVYSSPVQVGSDTTWKSASVGIWAALATKTDGTLWSWGHNGNGGLGQNNNIRYSSPTQIPGTDWNTIACGYYNSAATKTDGTLWSWGKNDYGVLGHNQANPGPVDYDYSSPTQIPGTNWISVSLNGEYMLALKSVD